MFALEQLLIVSFFIGFFCGRTCWSEAKPVLDSMDMCKLVFSGKDVNRMQCVVPRGNVLDYRVIRNWSEKETKGKLSFHISCEGGFVYLPWPFKAKNIVCLEVKMCTVLGFLSEMTITQSVPDELRSLVLSNVSVELPIMEMMNLRNNIDHVQRNTDCGQLTLETLVLKDIHYDFKITPEERDDRQRGAYARSTVEHGSHGSSCVYNHLKYIDESGSRQNGQHYIKLIPEYSVFPMLEVYNMSNNGLDHIPKSFRNLHSGKFPSLRHIDFSHNLLNSFEFDFPKDPKTCKLEVVNLSHNRIINISPFVTRQLKAVGKIMVDLRQNPLRCSCGMVLFRQYLKSLYQTTNDIDTRKRVSDITCMSRLVVNGTFAQISVISKTFDMKCNQ